MARKKLFNPSDEETQVIGTAVFLQMFIPNSPITKQATAAAGEITRRHMNEALTHVQTEIGKTIDRTTGKPKELKLNPVTGAYE
jgi:hypothetical protein